MTSILDYFPLSSPRPKQVKALEYVEKVVNLGYRDIVLALPTGVGKSAVAATICSWAKSRPDLVGQEGGYTLVLQKVLQDQIASELERLGGKTTAALIKSAVEYKCPEYKACSAGRLKGRCTKCREGSCTYKMAKERFLSAIYSVTNYAYFFTERAHQATLVPRRVLVCDECFVAGTLVDGKDIANFSAGDGVKSFDHHQSMVVIKNVKHVFKSKPTSLVRVSFSNGRRLICTPGHPIYVDGRYVKAVNCQGTRAVCEKKQMPRDRDMRDLRDVRVYREVQATFQDQEGDKTQNVLLFNSVPRNNAPSLDGAGCSSVQGVRNTCYLPTRKCVVHDAHGCDDKLGVLLDEVPNRLDSQVVVDHDERHQLEACQTSVRENEDKQPSMETWCLGKNTKENGQKEVQDPRRKWSRTDRIAGVLVQRAGFLRRDGCDGGAYLNQGVGGQGTAAHLVLPGRHRYPGHTPGRRDRWRKSRLDKTETHRRLEDQTFERPWVVSVEILEQSSDGTFGGLCPDGYVYNLEVEDNHNYFANGILVHNCHHLPKTLTRFVQVEIAADKMMDYAPTLEDYDLNALGKRQPFIDWVKEHYLPAVHEQATVLAALGNGADDESLKLAFDVEQHFIKVSNAIKEYECDHDDWVFWKSAEEGAPVTLTLRPLEAGRYFNEMIGSAADLRVYMSAYPGAKSVFCRELGLIPSKVAWLSVSSGFSPESRPVYMTTVGSLSRVNLETNWPPVIRSIGKIVGSHPERGIIHTHSYAIANKVFNELTDMGYGKRLIYPREAEKREAAMVLHAKTEGSILISPSVGEGFDFRGDLARWQIIAKCPWPSLGDRQVEVCAERDPEWYKIETLKSVIQTVGRICRSEDDFGVTYILDEDIKRLLATVDDHVPNWFKAALIYT